MSAFTSDTALVFIDFINEIVDPKGKLAGKGYAKFDDERKALQHAAALLGKARASGAAIVHVRVGFSPDYKEQPEDSPLFGAAKKFGALKLGDWGTEFHPLVLPAQNEGVLVKHRVSAFYGTPLEAILRTYGVKKLIVAGCATDVAVQAAARDAHDRDFACIVAADCCIAATEDDHQQALRMLAKVASIQDSEALFC